MTEREEAVVRLMRDVFNKVAVSMMLEMGVEPETVATHLDEWLDEQ